MSNSSVTFVTIGPLAGKTVNLGPGGKFRFVDGEMVVPGNDAGLVATALRWCCAAPKGDARPLHLAACAKARIDPDTLEPVDFPDDPPGAPVSEKFAEEVDRMAANASVSSEELRQQVEDIVAGMDSNNKEQWTQAGLPNLNWLRSHWPDEPEVANRVDRDMLNAIGVTRDGNLGDI